jgi:hypothetical protein
MNFVGVIVILRLVAWATPMLIRSATGVAVNDGHERVVFSLFRKT